MKDWYDNGEGSEKMSMECAKDMAAKALFETDSNIIKGLTEEVTALRELAVDSNEACSECRFFNLERGDTVEKLRTRWTKGKKC
jgi:hypothetical protein